jgi:hypothetical protein
LQSSLDVPLQSKYIGVPPGGTTVAQKLQSQGLGVPAAWPLARPIEVIAGAAQTRPPAAMPRVMSVRLLRLDVRPSAPDMSIGLPASFGLVGVSLCRLGRFVENLVICPDLPSMKARRGRRGRG